MSDVPAVLVVRVPQVQVVVETVQIPQWSFVEKIVVIPESRTVQDTQTSESVNTAFVRHVTQAEMVHVVEIGAPLPGESASPTSVTAPVVKGLITALTNVIHSVLDGMNKLGHDIASGVYVGKDDLDDGKFELAEASMQQRRSSQHQSAKQFARQAARKNKMEEEREKRG